MVIVQQYKPNEYMINVTKNEAMLLIKSLAAQLANDDSNRGRAEFSKRHEDDAQYFSIAVNQSVTKYDVITNMGAGNPTHDIALNRLDTMEKAQEFMDEFKDKGIMSDYTLWIKEVQI